MSRLDKALATLGKDSYQSPRSPSGGKVDARVSNTLAARRPGSSPGTGTTHLLFGQVPGSATSHPDRCSMRQLYIGNPRMDALNETLFALGLQPMLFGPAAEVKALTFASFYGAGPRKLSKVLNTCT